MNMTKNETRHAEPVRELEQEESPRPLLPAPVSHPPLAR